MMTAHSLSFILMAILVGGCATTDDITPKFDLKDKSEVELQEHFRAKFGHEWAAPDNKQPSLGLALSGGGTKAAMFAHGVLQGLNDIGLLDEVDAISSVSGGGYAALWYFSKRLDAQRLGFDYKNAFRDCFPAWWEDPPGSIKPLTAGSTEKEKRDWRDAQVLAQAFKKGRDSAAAHGKESCRYVHHYSAEHPGDPYRWQAHIERWPELFNRTIQRPTGDYQPMPWSELTGLVFSALFEVTVGWLEVESYVVRSYQNGIERTWGLNPLPRDPNVLNQKDDEGKFWRYSNAKVDEDAKGTLHVEPSKITWEQLRDQYKRQSISTTKSGKLPLWIVNATEGNKGRLPNLGNIFEITPLGYGSPRLGYERALPPAPINDLATSVRASAAFVDSQGLQNDEARTGLNLVSAIIPAGRWGVPFTAEKDGETKKYRLSDGGGAENLGLVSLVRRGLKDIIVADAAQDIKGTMEDVCWARQALTQEGLELTFDVLENLESLCKSQFERDGKQQAYNLSEWMNPVIHGVVKWGKSNRVTNIWLIKPAWNQQAVRKAYNNSDCGPGSDEINCTLLVFYGHNSTITNDDGYMVFPQHGTVMSTAKGSTYLTIAYRELGRMLASHLKRSPRTNEIEIQGDHRCLQPALLPVGTHRPIKNPGEGNPHYMPECKPIPSVAVVGVAPTQPP